MVGWLSDYTYSKSTCGANNDNHDEPMMMMSVVWEGGAIGSQ